MPDGGQLTLTAENVRLDESYVRANPEAQTRPYVVITTADTGAGIPPEVLVKMFDPFFTTKAPGKGTGLGLATVQGLVKNHGGFLTVDSQVNAGTTFKVYLPAFPDARAQTALKKEEIPTGHGELVLIVDDDVSICEITKASLETYNYRTLVAHDGTEAASLFAERKADIGLAVVDLVMPFVDGVAAIRALKKMQPAVPVIGMTGENAEELRHQAREDGAMSIIQKPFTARELLAKAGEALQP